MYLFTFHKYNSPDVCTSCPVVSNSIIYMHLENVCIICFYCYWKSCFPLVSMPARNFMWQFMRHLLETHSTWISCLQLIPVSWPITHIWTLYIHTMTVLQVKNVWLCFFFACNFHFRYIIKYHYFKNSLNFTPLIFDMFLDTQKLKQNDIGFSKLYQFARWKQNIMIFFFIECQLKIVNSG